jgi:hypothetical protein
MTTMGRILTLSAAILASGPAAGRACPVCSRPEGRRVRAGILDGRFGVNLLAAALPFGILFGVAAAVRFAPRPDVFSDRYSKT